MTPKEMLDKLDRWIRWYCPGVLGVAEKPSLTGLQEIRDYIAATLEPWTKEPAVEGDYWWRPTPSDKPTLCNAWKSIIGLTVTLATHECGSARDIGGEFQKVRPPND